MLSKNGESLRTVRSHHLSFFALDRKEPKGQDCQKKSTHGYLPKLR